MALLAILRAALACGVAVSFQASLSPARISVALSSSAYKEAVKNAEELSAKFGPSSTEAKAAWEAVEDLNDNADQASAGVVADPEAVAAKLAELSSLMTTSKPQVEAIKVELGKIAGAKLFDASASVADSSADVARLTAEAEKATADFGAESPEAKAAWEAVEDMNDSTNTKVASIPGLDEACLTETIEKCLEFEEAMASLEKSIANLNG